MLQLEDHQAETEFSLTLPFVLVRPPTDGGGRTPTHTGKGNVLH